MKSKSLLTLIAGALLSGSAISQVTASFSYEKACVAEETKLTSTSILSDPNDSILNYEWDIDGDGLFDEYIGGDQQQVLPVFPFVNTWSVGLRITTLLNGVKDTTIDVVVTDIPVANFSSNETCINDPVLFTNSSTVNGGLIGQTIWDFGDGSDTDVAGASNVSNNYGKAETFTVTQIAISEALCADTLQRDITIQEAPTARIVTQNNTTQIGISQTLELSVDESVTNIQWSTGETTSAITVDMAGTYFVSSNDGSGCNVRDTVTITETSDKDYVYNAFSPNGDGSNDFWKIKNIDAYEKVDVKVFDKRGALVLDEANYQNNWEGDFNGNKLPEGVYYYHVVLNGDTENTLRGTLTILSAE